MEFPKFLICTCFDILLVFLKYRVSISDLHYSDSNYPYCVKYTDPAAHTNW